MLEISKYKQVLKVQLKKNLKQSCSAVLLSLQLLFLNSLDTRKGKSGSLKSSSLLYLKNIIAISVMFIEINHGGSQWEWRNFVRFWKALTVRKRELKFKMRWDMSNSKSEEGSGYVT